MSETQKKNHIPFAIVYFISYAFMLFMQYKDVLQNISSIFLTQWSSVLSFFACLFMIVVLALRKKGVLLFIAVSNFAIIRIAIFVSGFVSGGFSIFAVISLIAYLFFAFYVGTVCIEPLKKHHDSVKKLYFIPGLILAAVAFIPVIQNLNLFNILNAVVLPSAFHLVAFWCSGTSAEKGMGAKHAQRLFFFGLACIIVVVMGVMYFSKETPKAEESENYDSVADYIEDQDPDLYNDIVDRYDSAVQDYNNSNNKNSGGSSYGNSSDKQYGAGGYEMPNENDKSFSDYVQRVDPDLYNDIVNNYNDAVGY